MGKRTHRISTYVTDDTYDWLKGVAERDNMSVSRMVARFIAREELSDLEADVSKKAVAEERIQTLVNLGKDELLDVARFVEDVVARAGCYAVADWEFLKRLSDELDLNITDSHRREFLRRASKRLRERAPELEEVEERKGKKFEFGE